MALYLIAKSVIVAALLAAGFGCFFIRARKLVKLMLSVKGQRDFKPDRVNERLKVLLTDILGQTNVRRKLWPGLAHTLIFFGFLAVQPHSLELMIRGIFPSFSAAHIIPGLYGLYLAIADILAFLVLIGLGYGLYRRLALKPKYLTDSLDARLIILFTSVIILSFHFYNAFHLALPAAGFDYGRYFTISQVLANALNLSQWSSAGIIAGLELSYWVHLLTILGFLVYIPGSKHLHLLAGIPNVFYKPLDIAKPMLKTDIENEAAETFGLSRLEELSWKNVLDLYACTECGRCEERCPANLTGKPLSPKNVIHEIKVNLLTHADAIISGQELESLPALVSNNGGPISKDALWACTTCRGCEDICPVNIQHLDIILEARKHQVLMQSDFPAEMQETFGNLENQSNPWGFSSDKRADWCKDLNVPLMKDHPHPAILYFVGCAGSFDDRGVKISRAIVSILKKAGVDFAILGTEEQCNGDMARRCGNEYLAQAMINANVETLNRYQPKRILTGCPHCFNTLKNEYPQFGANYEVVHHTDFMRELIEAGKLRMNGAKLGKITFHDSCYSGRWNGLYEAPRQVLAAVNQGAPVQEMVRHRDNSLCCGAGGARMFMEETIGRRINNERAQEALSVQADIISTACPFCLTMLRDGVRDSGGKAEVKDLAEIVDQATS